MKVMTILGTRPEIIRLSRIIPKLDKCCDHILVNTGQNYDPSLNAVFLSTSIMLLQELLTGQFHRNILRKM